MKKDEISDGFENLKIKILESEVQTIEMINCLLEMIRSLLESLSSDDSDDSDMRNCANCEFPMESDMDEWSFECEECAPVGKGAAFPIMELTHLEPCEYWKINSRLKHNGHDPKKQRTTKAPETHGWYQVKLKGADDVEWAHVNSDLLVEMVGDDQPQLWSGFDWRTVKPEPAKQEFCVLND